jgi:hypothetical protein
MTLKVNSSPRTGGGRARRKGFISALLLQTEISMNDDDLKKSNRFDRYPLKRMLRSSKYRLRRKEYAKEMRF